MVSGGIDTLHVSFSKLRNVGFSKSPEIGCRSGTGVAHIASESHGIYFTMFALNHVDPLAKALSRHISGFVVSIRCERQYGSSFWFVCYYDFPRWFLFLSCFVSWCLKKLFGFLYQNIFRLSIFTIRIDIAVHLISIFYLGCNNIISVYYKLVICLDNCLFFSCYASIFVFCIGDHRRR